MPQSITRRQMLLGGSLAAAGTLLSGSVKRAAAADTGSTKNMHVSLAAYSMRQALTAGEIDLFDFIDWCADLGLAGTELTSYYFPEDFDNAYLQKLKNRAFRRGVTISGTAVRNNFCLPPGEEKQQHVHHVIQWIDHAAALFAPHIRIFAGNLPDGVETATGVQWVADGVKAVLDHAGEKGIMIGLENHHGITARVADHMAICDAVGEHPWFGVNLDTGNYFTDAYEELAVAAPRAVNVQVKVEITRNDGEREQADYQRLRDILVAAEYKGWVTLEYEGREEARVAVPRHLDALRVLFE